MTDFGLDGSKTAVFFGRIEDVFTHIGCSHGNCILKISFEVMMSRAQDNDVSLSEEPITGIEFAYERVKLHGVRTWKPHPVPRLFPSWILWADPVHGSCPTGLCGFWF